jgi:hypothetical protein
MKERNKDAQLKNMSKDGGFTLPGEAGYENLTLELAEKWGADSIRDSDGTVLSENIYPPAIRFTQPYA